jgi:hypothetical protein
VESSPPFFAEWLSDVIGMWFLWAHDSHPRLWTALFATTALVAIVIASAQDYASGAAHSVTDVIEFAVVGMLIVVVIFGISLLDSQPHLATGLRARVRVSVR